VRSVAAHCTLHVTPPGVASFVTVAFTGTRCVAVTVAGGDCVRAIVAAGGTMVVTTDAGLAGLVEEEVAVIVTVPPAGIAAGAV